MNRAEWYLAEPTGFRVALPGTYLGTAGCVVGSNGNDGEVRHPENYALVLPGGTDAVIEGSLPELAQMVGRTARMLDLLIRASERAAAKGSANDAQTITLLVPNGRREALILPEGVSA